ncbi:hypothetical protein LWI29_001050 [Acer saccharum]|uniref:Uncharacterized protein n=1 Tax=Acer saccharum TaxID=4024 RepID=A0AA39SQ82_ACESA|nr:hypothetical protein LWI29_001050 [Acer saccharum]
MSTYLVAVVVGLFDHIEDTTADGVKVRAYCPVGRSDEGKFALELTIKSLDIFTKYFSTPYPLPVEVEVHHVHGVEQVFDDIGYRKGSAVIRMLHGYLGDDIFQSQFLSSGLHGDGEWTVPITLALGSYDKCKNFLMESKFGTVDISEFFPSSDETLWIKVNAEQSGFYRVMYEDRLAAQLRKAVENNCLLATDKFGAIPDSVNVLKEFFISLLQCSAEKLGWESIPGESHLDVMLRGGVFIAFATFGHDKTRRETMQRFQVLLNDKNTPLLSADVRKAAYISVMRNSSTTNRNGFESLLKFYREVDAMQEKERILQSLASSPDLDIVLEVLEFLLSDEIPLFIQQSILSSNEKAEEVEAFFGSHVNPAVGKILKQSIERIRIKARSEDKIGSIGDEATSTKREERRDCDEVKCCGGYTMTSTKREATLTGTTMETK